MGTQDKRVDAYITAAPPFARPILRHLRALVHSACPAAEETLKWGRPHFMYRGMLCGMSAFKQHCAFGFWKGSLVVAPAARPTAGGMGQFGRVTMVADLPSARAMKALVRAAMALNEAGIPTPRRGNASPKPPPKIPADLGRALKANATARVTFAALSPSGQREYVEWLGDAKRADTRRRRLVTSLEWLAAGKGRNWQYERAR